jgi:hypothetical protein
MIYTFLKKKFILEKKKKYIFRKKNFFKKVIKSSKTKFHQYKRQEMFFKIQKG